MKLLISGIFFDWYAVKVKTETFDVHGTHTGFQQEIVRVRNPIFTRRSMSDHHNQARIQALKQAKEHTHFCTCFIDDWE